MNKNIIAEFEKALNAEPEQKAIMESWLDENLHDLGLVGMLKELLDKAEFQSRKEIPINWFVITEDMVLRLENPSERFPTRLKPEVLAMAKERMDSAQYQIYIEGSLVQSAVVPALLKRKEFPIRLQLTDEYGDRFYPQSYHDRQAHLAKMAREFGTSNGLMR